MILAADGLEGINCFQANRARIRLVLLDMVMPGISGKETAQRLEAIDPLVPIIITSGFSMELCASELLNEGVHGFLHKPYGRAELGKALEMALARSNT